MAKRTSLLSLDKNAIAQRSGFSLNKALASAEEIMAYDKLQQELKEDREKVDQLMDPDFDLTGMPKDEF